MTRKTPISETSAGQTLAATTRLRIFVMSEKGGVWKTALVIRLVPFLEAAGLRVGIVQVDQQPQLERLFPRRVTTIAMPDAATLREDDTADAVALSPVYDTLLDPRWDVVIVDVGANLDQRVFAFMTSIALHEVLAAAGMTLVGLVPMRAEDEAVALGCRTLQRFPLALPEVRTIPVLCAENRVSFSTLHDDVQERFDAIVGPHIAAGEMLHFPRLNPRAVQELGRSDLTAHAFANLDSDALSRLKIVHEAVARQVQGDIIRHVADLDERLARLFGSFRGAGGTDCATAS